MALDFPNSPTIGDEFTGGGFTWVWDGASWTKLAAAAATTTSNGFVLYVGDTGNTTYVLPSAQPAGSYSISSNLGDVTYDVYLVASDYTNAGYTSSLDLEASQAFTRVVVYGSTTDDILTFEYKASVNPTGLGDVTDGAAPFLTSATPTTLESIDDTTTVTGGNFATDVQVVFIGQDAVERPAKTVVRSSSTSLIVTRPDDFPPAQEPYSMKATNAGITNPTLNVHILTDYFDAGGAITWVTTSPLPAASEGEPYSETVSATDPDSLPITYAVTAGSLPTGLSLNTSTGEISGTPTLEESQTFTLTATDSGGNTADREFTLTVLALQVEYLVVAGGGGGGAGWNGGAGGGGAGGYLTSSGPYIPETSYTVTVGGGGAVYTDGQDSVFASITADGGGSGGPVSQASGTNGNPGGSGGGGSHGQLVGSIGYGGSGTVGQGNDGGRSASNQGDRWSGGGGGGAGAAGANAPAVDTGGDGGDGLSSSITGTAITRAGGGGGAGVNIGTGGAGGGGNGGVGATPTAGAVNTGGGGGGNAAAGGSGVVILKYPDTFVIIPSAGLVFTSSTSGGYTIVIFTAGTGTIQFASASSVVSAEYVVVAGGGGGGLAHGAGGGAGGYRSSVSGENSGGGASAESPTYLIPSSNFTVTVGAGGPAAIDTSAPADGTGANSIFGSITSYGGGGGGGYSTQNQPSGVTNGAGGGSGGGSWGTNYGYRATGISGQGFDGGIGTAGGAYAETTGGGGGAGAQGGDGVQAVSVGNGGAGVTSSITGTAVTRAGGGGGAKGGQGGAQTGGAGGAGGGGRGGEPSNENRDGRDGVANTGGGGGGGTYVGTSVSTPGFAGKGGSGVVIIRVADTYRFTASAGLVFSQFTTAGKTVAVFMAGTGTAQVVPASATATLVEYLVVAGGGAGGSTTYDTYGGGGGGAGGYRSSVAGESSGGGSLTETTFEATLGTAYTLTVGAGGTGGGGTATNGVNSVLDSIVAYGGGRGAGYGSSGYYDAADGGSGGGGTGADKYGQFALVAQGFQGGNGVKSSSPYAGGGGGGAGAAGGNAAAASPSGSGGNGVSSSVTGVATVRGGGGAAGTYVNAGYGLGSPGTGGGGTATTTAGGNGVVNTGGGGAGASYNPNGYSSGNGGSGIVVLRYPSARTLTIGAGLTSSTSIIGANKVTVFTAGTDTITMS